MTKQMRTVRYEMILRAEEPIAHFERTIGNHAIAHTEKVVGDDGEIRCIPDISGNALRHGMRKAGVFLALDMAGLNPHGLIDDEYIERLLFNGGANLEAKAERKKGKGPRGARRDDWARMVDLLPPIELFGCSLTNGMEHGLVSVSRARLLCDDQPKLSDWCDAWQKESGRAFHWSGNYLQKSQHVKMDHTVTPRGQAMLTDGARANVSARLLANETASQKGDEIAQQENKGGMMPHTFQSIARGSVFHWTIAANLDTDLQEDTLLSVLAAFLGNARAGGKGGTGHGRLACLAASSFRLDRPAEATTALGGRAGDMFRAHMQERGEPLRKFLDELAGVG